MSLLEQWEEATKYIVNRNRKPNKNGCELYVGRKNLGARFKIDGKWKTISLHRMAYSLFVGDIPKGKLIVRTCYNEKCINPKHLKASTRKEFSQDILNRENYKIHEWKPKRKLSTKQIVTIRLSDLTPYQLAKFHKVSPTHIRRIKSGSRCAGIK